MIRNLGFVALALALPATVEAAGGGSSSPPAPTETTTDCPQGTVWDGRNGKCVNPQSGSLDDETLYGAARELAYAGRYGEALAALDAMSDQQEDRVLTYRGFATRKMGDVAAGMAFYRAALDVNPDNLLVRSYMGQAFVEQGRMVDAREQLAEIRRRGGEGTWPETALQGAIDTGTGYSY